ncbi:putative ABC transporter permease [Ruminococcaceae bacterium OttesenSCG-928-A16]|nr:putative ABC transporter permease [Ruminococcaceae bacterium OttesenSCG-928-A16]
MFLELLKTVAAHVGVVPKPAYIVIMFFCYSLIGYCLECVVLTVDNRKLTIDRGFVRHLPFCIIYGFGGIIGFALLRPFAGNWLLLFVTGALCATAFEYFTAQLQLRIFGSFWWDYTEKPFNYKGILCLESTLGWGIVALIIVNVLHRNLAGLVQQIPLHIATPVAFILLAAYVLDFIVSARVATQQKHAQAAAPSFEENTALWGKE